MEPRHRRDKAGQDPDEVKAGQVAAFETVTLYGVTLASRRRVNYGPINPAEAREIFLRFALVEGDFDTRATFWRHNRELIEYLQHLEAKSRRRDILVDEEAVYAFYAERIPSGIYNTAAFERWLRKVSQQQPKLLHMRMSDLMRREADIAIRHVRPDQPDLIARLIRETTAHIYGASAYFDRYGRPGAVADLAGQVVDQGESSGDAAYLDTLLKELDSGSIRAAWPVRSICMGASFLGGGIGKLGNLAVGDSDLQEQPNSPVPRSPIP